MNKHILFVMKYVMGSESVTRQELADNRDAAYIAADTSATYDDAYAAYYAADAAADATYSNTTNTEKWLSRYFDRSGEDRQAYLNELKKPLA